MRAIVPFTAANMRDKLMKSAETPAHSAAGTASFLDFIADDAARAFWVRYMGGEKRIATEDGMEMMEGWFLKGGISMADVNAVLPGGPNQPRRSLLPFPCAPLSSALCHAPVQDVETR